MNRHTIVLAEEKETIRRLVKKAIDTKPKGQERVESVVLVNDETQFQEILNHYPAIILLSTTFSSTSHEALIAQVTEKLPYTKVISLTNKYGDRSSVDYGAFDSVDKPIRNPVLWRVLDGAIEALDKGTPTKPVEKAKVLERASEPVVLPPVVDVQKPVVVQPVVSKPADREPEKPVFEIEEPKKIPVFRETTRPASSSLLVVSDDDDDDDDDLFGDTTPVQKRYPSPVTETPAEESIPFVTPINKPFIFEKEDEETVEEITAVELSNPTKTEDEPAQELFEFDVVEEVEVAPEVLRPHSVINDSQPDVVLESESTQANDKPLQEEDSFSFDIDDSEEQEELEPEEATDEGFSIEVEPPALEWEMSDSVKTETPLKEEVPEVEPFVFEEPAPEPIKVHVPVQVRKEVKTPSDTLEQDTEINTEPPIYNELSEWTLAHEGFTTKKGDFVPLAPPRELMMKHSPSGGKAHRSNTTKAVSNDGNKLFGSVRNRFKKK